VDGWLFDAVCVFLGIATMLLGTFMVLDACRRIIEERENGRRE
jgi:hypothetical protein